MSGADQDPKEQAREFLNRFLQQLAATDQSNRTLQQTLAQLLQQGLTNQQYMAGLTAQMAQLADDVDKLSRTIAGEPMPPATPVLPLPSFGQALGGVVGYAFDQVQGGGRRRRR